MFELLEISVALGAGERPWCKSLHRQGVGPIPPGCKGLRIWKLALGPHENKRWMSIHTYGEEYILLQVFITSDLKNSVAMLVQKVLKYLVKKIICLTLRGCSTWQNSNTCVVKTFCLKKPDIHRERTQQQRLLCGGRREGSYWRINPLFLAQTGAGDEVGGVYPSAKLKLELRFIPCYSATAFECCLYVCCLERVGAT